MRHDHRSCSAPTHSGRWITGGILLVDDHQIARKGVRALLDANALSICGEAENGLQAIDRVRALKPELVLLDLYMPGMNGVEAAFQIRQIAPATKIIFLTVQDCTPEAEAAVRLLGVQGFICKSCAATDLIPALKRSLQTD
ncbi:MAG TPA: response regulator transcription factor [Candidatus Acidoferrales bacterium]|nr:response regulator transcription factor [Candidatus Acidoferrales bacterium]